MLARPIITLTTDFGLKDPFVGVMKGVIAGINPNAIVIDISHNISPQNIFEASQVISMSYKYFPPTTIHVVVVDPGVGSQRRPILVVTDKYYFIGPDNGVFTPIFEEQHTIFKVIHITSKHYYLSQTSSTFHGRDIFAPVAAWLSKGIQSSRLGEEINDYVKIQIPKPQFKDGILYGEVVYIDSFGNAMTNISRDYVERAYQPPAKGTLKVLQGNREFDVVDCYEKADGLDGAAVLNSSGFLELFTYKGSIADRFNIKIGEKVNLILKG